MIESGCKLASHTEGRVGAMFLLHSAAALTGFTAFLLSFLACVMYLRVRKSFWDRLASSAAEMGIVFTLMSLVAGVVWTKTIWSVWWVWSSRMTLGLVLCLLYVSYMQVRKGIFDDESRAAIAAVLGIVIFLDTPLLWASIYLWRARHPLSPVETNTLPHPTGMTAWALRVAFEALLAYLLVRRVNGATLPGRAAAESDASELRSRGFVP